MMLRSSRTITSSLTLTLVAASLATTATWAQEEPLVGHSTFALSGDEGGSKFEGIGVDQSESSFYVSEVTGGEIHRGDLASGDVQEWMAEGRDDRFTARGITTDAHDRIYIAGGPNGLDTERPDMWVYSPDGELLAALKVDAADAFINDVAIGPDGAAYFTNSNAPQIFRVEQTETGWTVETWLDASEAITQRDGFNLGGIVVSPDGSSLVVAQGNVGLLWRVDLSSGMVQPVDTGNADVTGADGLVLHDGRLTVVRNFPQSIATLELEADGSAAMLLDDVATDPDRVLTTAKIAGSNLLLVDSKFDEETAEPPFEVLAIDLGSLVN
jgi:sugar lactone lactonase YvrE